MIIDKENSNRQYMYLLCTRCETVIPLEFVGFTNAGECDCGLYESHAMVDQGPLSQHYGPFVDIDAVLSMQVHDEEDELGY